MEKGVPLGKIQKVTHTFVIPAAAWRQPESRALL
jgi:hypothetical protein